MVSLFLFCRAWPVAYSQGQIGAVSMKRVDGSATPSGATPWLPSAPAPLSVPRALLWVLGCSLSGVVALWALLWVPVAFVHLVALREEAVHA